MNRNLLFSFALHLVVVAVTLASASFHPRRLQLGEVVRVQLTPAPTGTLAPQPLAPVSIPAPTQALDEDIPLDEPVTAPKAKIPAKKVKKPAKPRPKSRADTSERSAPASDSASQEVASSGGTPFAGATIDNASFDYPYWFTQSFYKIQSNWRNPVAADYALIAVVYFQVLKSGRVVEITLRQSSGVPAYDQACLSAVEQSAPFPPLPRDFTDEIIGITLPFKFEPSRNPQ